MNIQIKSADIDLTDKLKQHAEEKIRSLTKYLGGISVIDAKIKLAMTSKHHQKGDIYECEVALDLPGQTLRVSKVTSDIYKAIDKVKDHLERSIDKYKEKHT